MGIEEAYKDQYEFNKMFLAKKGIDIDAVSKEDLVHLSKDFIIHIVKELTEALDTLKFKMHRKEEVEFIRSNTVEELIDVQKFLWGLFQIHGVDYEELVSEYWRKTEVVKQRFQQEFCVKELSKHEKVVAIDLDGVLCEYPGYWLKYLNSQLSTDYRTLEDAKRFTDILTYEKIKSQYRQSGEEMNVPAIEGAKEFLEALKSNGYMIVILTSRPYKRYYRLFADTITWLKNNQMPYDSILFDEQKNMKILKELPNLKWMVEDNARFANSVAAAGYQCYIVGNCPKPLHPAVTRAINLQDILKMEKIVV